VENGENKGVIMRKLVLLSLLIASNAALAANDCADVSQFGEVSRQELSKLVESKTAFVVDVNSAESFKKNHVPTAIHYGSNEKNFIEMLPRDKNTLIVAYCGGPQCTAWQSAAKAACKAGYTQIKHYKGGISGWLKKS
jgi:rhodanese-related sulfurtransferase